MSSWREEKRRRTEASIREAAVRLFLEEGYRETTVSAIADAAGVSARTVFDYAVDKPGTVAIHLEQTMAEAFAYLRARGDGTDTLDAVHAWIAARLRDRGTLIPDDVFGIGFEAEVIGLIEQTPELFARCSALFDNLAETLAAEVAVDLGRPAPDLRSTVAASAVAGALQHLALTTDDVDTVLAGLTEAITFARAGLQAVAGAT